MIYFFADDHYESHPGKVVFEHLPAELKGRIAFYDNEWDVLEHADLKAVNSPAGEKVFPADASGRTKLDQGEMTSLLKKASWNVIRLGVR